MKSGLTVRADKTRYPDPSVNFYLGQLIHS